MNTDWLAWIAGLMGNTAAASASPGSPGQFACSLENLPLHLLPRAAGQRLASEQMPKRAFRPGPRCRVLSARRFCETLPADLEGRFFPEGVVACVENAATGAVLPFWLSARQADLLDGLSAQREMDWPGQDDCSVLFAAGILEDPETDTQWIGPSRDQIAEAAYAFRERSYAPIRNLIHPFHVAALRRYYRYLVRSGRMTLGDGQTPRRRVAHNEPVASFFHRQLTNLVGLVVGQPVKPSYVYSAAYLPGAELRKHTDREQCEFSVTFCLDFAPEPDQATPWPIHVETASGTTAVYQALGDGLVYRGTQVPHFRGRLGECQSSTSLFFHYVPAEFCGSLD